MMAPIRRPRPLSGATDLSDATGRASISDQAIEVDVRRHLIRFPARPTTRAQLTCLFAQLDSRSLSSADYEVYALVSPSLTTRAHVD